MNKWEEWKTHWEKLFSGKPPYVLIAIACLVGLVVSVEAYFLMGRSQPTISTPRYLIAVRDVNVGKTITPIDFDLILQTDVKAPPTDAISDQYLEKLRGAKMKSPMKAREILTWSLVAARNDIAGSIPKGLRAYPLFLKNSIPLMSGDYVDVMASQKGKSQGSVLMMEKILVVEAAKEKESVRVLLAVPPEEVSWLDKAKETGELHLVLRNPEDSIKKSGQKDPFKKKARVEILSEG